MDSVNKTLYIPLYGKAYVSSKGILLQDKKAEEIWGAEGFALKGKSKSKWLAYYMGMRSAVFDRWLLQQMKAREDAVVIHIGCGMDSRVLRVGTQSHIWYDVDFQDVIAERKKYYAETSEYKMLCDDIRDPGWLAEIPKAKSVIAVMEGVSMYVTHEDLQKLFKDLCGHFENVSLLMDCYSGLAAKMSKYKNPINDVGVTQVYGLDDPTVLNHPGFSFIDEHSMTPDDLIRELAPAEQRIFRKLYAGGFSKKLYRLYEYKSS